MSDLKITGTIDKILKLEKGTSKAGKDWQKQSFVLDTGEEFNNLICFSLFGEQKCDNFKKFNKVGDHVEVSFNLSSREFNDKWYHNLDAWKVFKTDLTHSEPQEPMEMPTPKKTKKKKPAEEVDDLPF